MRFPLCCSSLLLRIEGGLDLLLQLKHGLKLAAQIIEIIPHSIQCLQAPISALPLTKLTELNAGILHSLSTNTCTAALELMHKSIHLVEVHSWLIQQFGELADDPLAVLAEERDDLGNEVRGARVLEHLQLLELIVQQTRGEHVGHEGVELHRGRHGCPKRGLELAGRKQSKERGEEAAGIGVGVD